MLTVGRGGGLQSPFDKGHFAVTKKAVASNVRFVFAGVENPGHHVWHDMLSRLPVHFSQSLTDALDSKDGKIRPDGGVFGSKSVVAREDSAKMVVQMMSHMASNLSSMPGCKVVPLSLVAPNFISYISKRRWARQDFPKSRPLRFGQAG